MNAYMWNRCSIFDITAVQGNSIRVILYNAVVASRRLGMSITMEPIGFVCSSFNDKEDIIGSNTTNALATIRVDERFARKQSRCELFGRHLKREYCHSDILSCTCNIRADVQCKTSLTYARSGGKYNKIRLVQTRCNLIKISKSAGYTKVFLSVGAVQLFKIRVI